MNINEARDEIKRRWRELWPPDKGKGNQAGIICPLCGSGSGAHGSGVKLDGKNGGAFLHCFACGFNGDAITLLERETGGGYREAIEEGARRLSLPADWNTPAQAARNRPRNDERGSVGISYREEEKSAPKAHLQDFSSFIEAARAGLNDEAARAYLEGRGLFVETAAAYHVGFVKEWENPATGKATKRARLIVPFADNVGYLARALDDEKQGAKLNGGAVGLFGDVDAGDVVFIVEGWADALSVIQAGYKAIALNGAANGGKLIEEAERRGFSGFFLLALDNDEAGQKAAASLGEMMTAKDFPFSVVDICGGFKDENEFLSNDPDGFSFACLEAHENAKAAAERAARPDSLLEYVNGGGWREDVERGAANREKTGFPSLDDWLGGGLYEGMTVLSGFPSLGKTSLLWQIAENIAAGGCHVLFFSLEMSRADMIAKSLSRRAYKRGRDVTSDDAQSGRDACGLELKELLADVGARLEVIEGSFGYGVEAIRKRALLAKRRGGRLCVFVDYLQAAADYKGGGSEITAISDAAKAFRQMARELHCPVVCASSTARTTYKGAVDYSCFYGSGGIEFSADCAAGLQLSAVYSDEYIKAGRERQGGKERQTAIIEKASKESPRRVSLVGLKNRRGQMRRRVDFFFDARHSLFTENTSGQEAPLSASEIEELLDF